MGPYIAWFDELSRASVATAGGKGANLGEMAGAGLPVPPGFVVTTDAFLGALDAAGVRAELRRRFAEASPDDPKQLAASAEQLRALVGKAGMPP